MTRSPSDDDLHLWIANTQDVKRLERPERVLPDNNYKPPRVIPFTPSFPVTPFQDVKVSSPEFQTKSRKLLRSLTIDGRLDLHGHTHAQAWSRLLGFINAASQQGHKTILIITGKGSLSSDQTLKIQVPRWLAEPPFRSLITGHQTAKQEDGGEGALYIFLKRNRPHS